MCLEKNECIKSVEMLLVLKPEKIQQLLYLFAELSRPYVT